MSKLFEKIDREVVILVDKHKNSLSEIIINALKEEKLLDTLAVTQITEKKDNVKFGVVIGESQSTTREVENKEVIQKLQKVQKIIKSTQVSIDEIKKFKEEKLAIESAVRASGLPVMSVLHKSVWSALCKKYGLYCFEHINLEGKTGAANNSFQILLSFILLFFIVPLSVVLSIIPMSGYQLASWITMMSLSSSLFIGFSLLPDDGESFKNKVDKKLVDVFMFLSVALFFASVYPFSNYLVKVNMSQVFTLNGFWGLVSWLVGIIASFVLLFGQVVLLFFITEYFLPKFSNRLLVRLLWPNKVDYPIMKKDVPVGVKFKFQASEGFISTLCRLQELNIAPRIATVPDAIAINKQEAISSILSKIDPIIYSIHNDFVVIHEQCGNFAPEENVINWVKKNSLKLLEI